MFRKCWLSLISLLSIVCGALFAQPAGAVDVLWVHEDHGPGFDVGWKDLLAANGHNVENRIFVDLDQAAIDEMNSAPLVIFSRDTNSGEYDDGDEPTQWNSVTAPHDRHDSLPVAQQSLADGGQYVGGRLNG